MKNKKYLLVLIFCLMLIGSFLLIRPKQPLILNDTRDITEKMVDAAYRDLGYYQGMKLPISLNLEKQEDRFSAQEEFYQYSVKALTAIKRLPDDFSIDNVIAYRFDLNDDGIDELIGVLRHPEVNTSRHGIGTSIMIKTDMYDAYPVLKKEQRPLKERIKYFWYYKYLGWKYRKSLNPKAPESILGWYDLYHGLGFISGVTILPRKTNGFYELRNYAEGEELIKSKNYFDFEVEYHHFSGEFFDGWLLRFSNIFFHEEVSKYQYYPPPTY